MVDAITVPARLVNDPVKTSHFAALELQRLLNLLRYLHRDNSVRLLAESAVTPRLDSDST